MKDDMRDARTAAPSPLPAGTPQAGGQVLLVQVLRGLAALIVLLGHAQGHVVFTAGTVGERVWRLPTLPSGFGVDLFFAISGFIMVVSSARLFEQPGARATFLRRRAFRLVPLYWLATCCFLLVPLLGKQGYQGHLAWATLASLLFFPYPAYGTPEHPYPIHTLGWSLNYEVFFYLIFSAFLVWPMRKAVCGTAAVMLAIVALGAVWPPANVALAFWSQPIVLEFALGLLIGWAWTRRTRPIPAWAMGAALSVALAWLLADPLGLMRASEGGITANDFARLLGWGLPAALILLSVSLYERGAPLKPSATLAALARLGDWSYSLYLMHPFALMLTAKIWLMLGLQRWLHWQVLGLMLVGSSVLLAMLSYRFIEKPGTRWLQQRFGKPQAARQLRIAA